MELDCVREHRALCERELCESWFSYRVSILCCIRTITKACFIDDCAHSAKYITFFHVWIFFPFTIIILPSSFIFYLTENYKIFPTLSLSFSECLLACVWKCVYRQNVHDGATYHIVLLFRVFFLSVCMTSSSSSSSSHRHQNNHEENICIDSTQILITMCGAVHEYIETFQIFGL